MGANYTEINKQSSTDNFYSKNLKYVKAGARESSTSSIYAWHVQGPEFHS